MYTEFLIVENKVKMNEETPNLVELIKMHNKLFDMPNLALNFEEVIQPFLTSKALFKLLLKTLNTIVQFPDLNVLSYIEIIKTISPKIKETFTQEELFPHLVFRRFAVLCLIKFEAITTEFLLQFLAPNVMEYFYKNTGLIGDNPDEIASMIRSNNIVKLKEMDNLDPCSKINYSLFERCQFVSDCTLLEYAAFFDATDVIEYLIEKGAEKTEKFRLCCILHENTCKYIMEFDEKYKDLYLTNESSFNMSKFHQLSLSEKEILIEYHKISNIAFNSEVLTEIKNDTNLYSILLKASAENSLSLVFAFLPTPKDEKTAIKPGLNAICEAGRDDLVEILSGNSNDGKYLINLDWNGRFVKTNSSIFEAAIKGNQPEVVQSLFNVKGIDYRGIYYHEESALHLAAKYNNTLIGHYILSTQKINVNCKDSVNLNF